MVYGSAFCAVKDEDKLKSMGFAGAPNVLCLCAQPRGRAPAAALADSKTLTEARREELWSELQASGFIGWKIRVLQAAEISRGMLGKHKYNLNAMSHDAAIGLVRQVMEHGVNLTHLYVDTVGDEGRYQEKLEGLFPTLSITVAKKADSKFPVVSAASICAKVRSGRAEAREKADGCNVRAERFQ
jgi:ribonuclease HII